MEDKPRCQEKGCRNAPDQHYNRKDGSTWYAPLCKKHAMIKYGRYKRVIKEQSRYATENPRPWWTIKRCGLLKLGQKTTITSDEFVEWFKKQPLKCVYCDVEVDTWKKLEIDRKIPKLGYVTGNIVFACSKCNRLKSDTFTFEEMRQIAQKYHLKDRYVPQRKNHKFLSAISTANVASEKLVSIPNVWNDFLSIHDPLHTTDNLYL